MLGAWMCERGHEADPLFPGRRNARITSGAVRLRLITDHARRPRLDARRWEANASLLMSCATQPRRLCKGAELHRMQHPASGGRAVPYGTRDGTRRGPESAASVKLQARVAVGCRIAPSVTMSHQVRVPQARQRVSRACASVTQVPRVGPVLNGATPARQVCGPCNPAARPLAAVRAAGRGRGPETPPPGSP